MEDVESLLQQCREQTSAKTIKRDQDELVAYCQSLAASLERTTRDLQATRTRVQQLEAENAHLRVSGEVSAGDLSGEKKEGLVSQLVALRDVLVEEHTEKEQLHSEMARLRAVNTELEQQLAQLSPTKLPPKKAKLTRSAAGEESRSYKSLYQKRRQQSDAYDYRFS